MAYIITHKISKGLWLFKSTCGNIEFNVYKDEAIKGSKKWVVQPVGKTTKVVYNKFPSTETKVKLFQNFPETIGFSNNILFCYEFRNHVSNPFNIFK